MEPLIFSIVIAKLSFVIFSHIHSKQSGDGYVYVFIIFNS